MDGQIAVFSDEQAATVTPYATDGDLVLERPLTEADRFKLFQGVVQLATLASADATLAASAVEATNSRWPLVPFPAGLLLDLEIYPRRYVDNTDNFEDVKLFAGTDIVEVSVPRLGNAYSNAFVLMQFYYCGRNVGYLNSGTFAKYHSPPT